MANENYQVPLPPSNNVPRPYEGAVTGFAFLSDLFAKKAATERDITDKKRAEELKLSQYNNEQARLKILDNRQAIADARNTKAYNTQQDMLKWQKNFNNIYDPNEIKKKKAKEIFNVDIDTLKPATQEQVLGKIDVYQEDVENYYGSDFLRKFGKPLDTTTIKPFIANLPSITALQATENANAKALWEREKFLLGKKLEAAKELNGNQSTSSSKTKTSAVKNYNDIRVSKMVKDFDVNSWYNPFTSEKQDAASFVQSIIDNLMMEKSTNKDGSIKYKYSPEEVKSIAEYALDRARTGSNLEEVDDNITDMATFIEQGKRNLVTTGNAYGNSNKSRKESQEYLMGSLKAVVPDTFNPRNMLNYRRNIAQQEIDLILKRGKAVVAKSKTPPSKNVLAPSGKSVQRSSSIWPSNKTTSTVTPSDVTALKAAEKAQKAETDLRIKTDKKQKAELDAAIRKLSTPPTSFIGTNTSVSPIDAVLSLRGMPPTSPAVEEANSIARQENINALRAVPKSVLDFILRGANQIGGWATGRR